MVPALVASMKELGLVVVADTSEDAHEGAPHPSIQRGGGVAAAGLGSPKMQQGIDGVLRGNGVLSFASRIDI